ncbi:MAG: transposase, partial [Rickettsia endosymbiont of Gnoriste bilineata]|nr:transposase [Rickettsia endosymbiont of Gnoriste bilineata]
NPLKFILTAGQRNDITQAENLTKDVQNTTVIGDKGYDSSTFVESLEIRGARLLYHQNLIVKYNVNMINIFIKNAI